MSDAAIILNWHHCACGNIIVIEDGETEDGKDVCEKCISELKKYAASHPALFGAKPKTTEGVI